jgi:hypothetical protein
LVRGVAGRAEDHGEQKDAEHGAEFRCLAHPQS